jgi:anti-sigma-K factor RskA
VTAEIHALIGAYVLDAVDDLERAAFERHLRDCEDCRAEADELQEVSSRLAGGVWSVPPPSLRTSVLAEIRSTRQLPPPTPDAPVKRDPRASRLRRLTAVAAAVVVAAGATYAVQDHRVREEHARAEAARAGEDRIRSVLAAADLVVRRQPLTGGGEVTVAVSKLQNAGVIMLAADASPAGGRVYQLWTVRSAAPHSEGALSPGQSTTVRIVEGIDRASAVAVTVEPAGGSAAPTLPMVGSVKIT